MKYTYFFIPRVKMKSISLKKRSETGYTLSSNGMVLEEEQREG